MVPGIFRLRTACCTLVIPIRLAICLPLLICVLDAYSPPAALIPQGGILPPMINNSKPTETASSNLPEDVHDVAVYEYIALRPLPPPLTTPHVHTHTRTHPTMGCALTLSFVITAAVLSIISMLTLWWIGDPAVEEDDDATLVEGERIATRLLLAGLGTTAMASVISERSVIKLGSFIAVEVLGWLLVAVMCFGVFYRIHRLLNGSGAALKGRRKEVIGKREGTVENMTS
ncbi:hypothetical protein B0F90DRAFT_1919051 [Multifurca ochricompacta]|uniref:Uncharacterized protein n=1 Tax=Multifurca ochricompacta TaxID=376703 RepID=A0AAD4LZ93_9AGAM|nr:hypothetical protein B0F90DRAFT_1919051 [Multifurca ochricompacta]